jgi:hypothetical protein
VVARNFVAVGHAVCGYFFLPPRQLWSEWAWKALQSSKSRDTELVVGVYPS